MLLSIQYTNDVSLYVTSMYVIVILLSSWKYTEISLGILFSIHQKWSDESHVCYTNQQI